MQRKTVLGIGRRGCEGGAVLIPTLDEDAEEPGSMTQIANKTKGYPSA